MLTPEFNAKLKDGTDVIVRTKNACNRECIAKEFGNLSRQSRYARFHMVMDKLSDGQLTYLADVDDKNHVLITIEKKSDETQSGLGLGRYIKLKNSKHIAEFAITVADKYQNQGVGSLLMELLIEHARYNNVEILRGYVLDSNKAMQKLLQRFNFKRTGVEDGLPGYDLVVTD